MANIQPYALSLIQARDAAAQTLADVLSEKKPSYSVNGVSFSWEQYAASLVKNVEDLTKLIQQGQSPFWNVSRGKA